MFIDFAQPISLPPYWLNHPEVVRALGKGEFTTGSVTVGDKKSTIGEALSVPHSCPLDMKWESEGDWWRLPIEPVVSISCRNDIVKRSVLKASETDADGRGTVKELWSQDDYEISISGVFIATDGKLPAADLRRLRAYCEGRNSVEVQSDLFTLFNIRKIAIDEFQFPFTQGTENQIFNIKASSDNFEAKELLIAKQ